MNDDITVVITCFNYGAYLPAAVDSATGAGGRTTAVVVVDDGSTELEALRALKVLPPEVTLIRQANAGLSAPQRRPAPATTPYQIVARRR